MVSKPPKKCWGDSTDSRKGTSLRNLLASEDSHESEAGTACPLLDKKQALLARFQHPNRKDARKMIVKPKRLGRLVGERC